MADIRDTDYYVKNMLDKSVRLSPYQEWLMMTGKRMRYPKGNLGHQMSNFYDKNFRTPSQMSWSSIQGLPLKFMERNSDNVMFNHTKLAGTHQSSLNGTSVKLSKERQSSDKDGETFGKTFPDVIKGGLHRVPNVSEKQIVNPIQGQGIPNVADNHLIGNSHGNFVQQVILYRPKRESPREDSEQNSYWIPQILAGNLNDVDSRDIQNGYEPFVSTEKDRLNRMPVTSDKAAEAHEPYFQEENNFLAVNQRDRLSRKLLNFGEGQVTRLNDGNYISRPFVKSLINTLAKPPEASGNKHDLAVDAESFRGFIRILKESLHRMPLSFDKRRGFGLSHKIDSYENEFKWTPRKSQFHDMKVGSTEQGWKKYFHYLLQTNSEIEPVSLEIQDQSRQIQSPDRITFGKAGLDKAHGIKTRSRIDRMPEYYGKRASPVLITEERFLPDQILTSFGAGSRDHVKTVPSRDVLSGGADAGGPRQTFYDRIHSRD